MSKSKKEPRSSIKETKSKRGSRYKQKSKVLKKVVKRFRKTIKKKIIKTTVVKTVKKVQLTKERKPKFNSKNRRFYAWEDDDFVIDILKKRGWKYVGEPVKDGRENYPKSMYQAREKGEIDKGACLVWADDDDSRVFAGLSSKHLISNIPNTDKALTKVAQQNMFNDQRWFPKCFTLPKESKEFTQYVSRNPKTFWIAKPRDSYGGFGMCVFRNGSAEFKTLSNRKTTFVVQQYLDKPYLLGGYKFHIRAYFVISNAQPLKSYLWKNFQVEFATHPFNLQQIEKKFNKFSHITNYKVNNLKKNKHFILMDKPVIGRGSEWVAETFFKTMKKDKRFKEKQFWRDLSDISKVVCEKMINYSKVQKEFQRGARTENHFEIFGLDVLLDENVNLYISEANTQPGLDKTNPIMLDGKFNPEIVAANDVTAGIVNDALTLLGIDNHKEFVSPFICLHK